MRERPWGFQQHVCIERYRRQTLDSSFIGWKNTLGHAPPRAAKTLFHAERRNPLIKLPLPLYSCVFFLALPWSIGTWLNDRRPFVSTTGTLNIYSLVFWVFFCRFGEGLFDVVSILNAARGSRASPQINKNVLGKWSYRMIECLMPTELFRLVTGI